MTGRCIELAGAATALSVFGALTAGAHHSSRGVYDDERTVEVQGVVERVAWNNPHVRFWIRGRSDTGTDALWEVEGASVAMLSRKGITRDALEAGDPIRVAGNPAIRDVPEMYVTNVLLPDGREFLTLPRVEPRWSDEPLRWSDWTAFPEETVQRARAEAHGIFRVWTTDFESEWGLWNESYPLTATARAAQQSWDPVDSPYVSCVKGMPAIMEQPYPLEFVELPNGDIALHIEEYDVVRTIEMSPEAAIEDRAPATWGHSAGRWDGETLVVTTTGISWPYFDQTGIPLQEDTRLVERFTPSADGRRLDYELTVADARIFTQPVTLTRHWIFKPGERVKPFNCVPPAQGR